MALSSMAELEVCCNSLEFLEFPLRFSPTSLPSFLLRWEQKLIAQDLSPLSPSHTTCASVPHAWSGKIKILLLQLGNVKLCPDLCLSSAHTGCNAPKNPRLKLLAQTCSPGFAHHHSSSSQGGHCGGWGGVTALA